MPNSNSTEGLTLTRIFNAPRAKVWRAWSDPEMVKEWWGPRIFFAPTIEMDFRVGGKYLYCMQSNKGEESWKNGIWSTGTYKEIVPMEKIVYTDSFADEKGDIVSGSYYGMEGLPMEFLVTVTLEDTPEGGTKMTLRHEGMPENMAKDASVGWNESFDKMAELLK